MSKVQMTEAEWLLIRQRKYDELSKLERVYSFFPGDDPDYALHKDVVKELDRLPWEQGGPGNDPK